MADDPEGPEPSGIPGISQEASDKLRELVDNFDPSLTFDQVLAAEMQPFNEALQRLHRDPGREDTAKPPYRSAHSGTPPPEPPTQKGGGFQPHHAHWLVIGACLAGLGGAGLLTLYVGQVAAPNILGSPIFWLLVTFCFGLLGLGAYVFIAPFADYPLPEPSPQTRQVWRRGSYIFLGGSIALIGLMAYYKILPAITALRHTASPPPALSRPSPSERRSLPIRSRILSVSKPRPTPSAAQIATAPPTAAAVIASRPIASRAPTRAITPKPSPLSTQSPTSAPSAVVAATPISPFVMTQKLIGPQNKDYPYALQITLQTDHEISEISVAIIFARGTLDANSFVQANVYTEGAEMLMAPRGRVGTFRGQPAMLVQLTSTPPWSPEHPLLITVQSKTDIWAQTAVEYRL